MTTPPLHSRLDHLVVVADTLAQGVAWCEATLGVTPGPGGRHALMGTHNRLLRIAGPRWPQAYLEIIAIDPAADALPADGRARWFGMDQPALRAAVRLSPLLVHLVVQTDDIARACAALAALGEQVGTPVAASRATPQGELRWQISLRDDGCPQHGGALPALIQWQGPHPSAAIAEPGLRLERLTLNSARPAALREALAAIGLDGVAVGERGPAQGPIEAEFLTPLGPRRLGGAPPAAGSPGLA